MRKTGIKKAHITLLKTELFFIAVAVIIAAFTAGFFTGRAKSPRELKLDTVLTAGTAALTPSGSSAAETAEPARTTLKTNINTAGLEELMELPGIGETIAGRIIEYRSSKGGFKKIEEIMGVAGIGEKTFEKIRDLITIE